MITRNVIGVEINRSDVGRYNYSFAVNMANFGALMDFVQNAKKSAHKFYCIKK